MVELELIAHIIDPLSISGVFFATKKAIRYITKLHIHGVIEDDLELF